MRERIERLEYDRQEFFWKLKEILMAFADSIAKLQTDVNALIAQNGNETAAIAAAVAAKDASDAAAVDAVDATVVAALAPAVPAAAPAVK
jgi:hypothetical protein